MYVRKLSPELQEKAIKVINEDPKRVQEDVEYIREWIKKQPHLNARTEDQWLLTFLRGCKFSLERTKEKLDMYYTIRKLIPDFFQNRDPMHPKLQKLLKLGLCLPIPSKDPLAPTILLVRTGIYDPSEFSMSDIFKMNTMISDIMLAEDDAYLINGMHIVQDMHKITMAHNPPPNIAKMAMTYYQDALPTRPQGIHFFRLPGFFEIIFNIFRPFVNEKMKNRLNVHTDDYHTLFEQIPKSRFPKEYGGEAGSIDEITEYWKKKVESYRDWFLEDAKYGTNESLRSGKPKTSLDLFGIDGSFRKLDVD